MALADIQDEIIKLLGSEEPQTLCIMGKWGVGKTYIWKDMVKSAIAKGEMVGDYSYVSLFGIDSLSDIKSAIFENTLDYSSSTSVTMDSYIERIQKKIPKAASSYRKLSPWLKFIPTYGDFIESIAGKALFLTVHDQVVCFDDLERLGGSVKVGDVMGLGLQLREEKRCRVVFLLNDDAFDGEDRRIFSSYTEKSFDRIIRLNPTPEEAANIAIGSGVFCSDLIMDNCKCLGISNIRTISRIKQDSTRIETIISDLDRSVIKSAIHALCLFKWSILEPHNAPPIDYISKRHGFSFLTKREELSSEEQKWEDILDRYSFISFDKFDQAILSGLQEGYFDRHEMRRVGEEISLAAEMKGLSDRYAEERIEFLFNFGPDDNDDNVAIARLIGSFYDCMPALGLGDLNHLFQLLNVLGEHDKANAALADFFRMHQTKGAAYFDYRDAFVASDVIAPEIRALADKLLAEEDKHDPLAEVLRRMAGSSGWGASDQKAMEDYSVDDYVATFDATSGEDLRTIIRGAKHFFNVTNADDGMKKVNATVREALTRIGHRTKLNALRVSNLGIKIDQQDSGEPSAGQ